MALTVTDKVVIISGAAGGIGRDTACAFARGGAKLVVTDLNRAGLEETAALVRTEGAEVLALEHDVTSEPGWISVCTATVERFGGGATHTTASVLGIEVPMASAVANVAEARRDYLEESGGRYVHIIADGAVGRSGDMAKAIACGADAVMVGSPLARATEAPGRGWHWGSEAWHQRLPRGERSFFEQVGTLEEVVLGPSRVPDGTMNLAGGLRKAMALTGYTDIKSFQRIDLILH